MRNKKGSQARIVRRYSIEKSILLHYDHYQVARTKYHCLISFFGYSTFLSLRIRSTFNLYYFNKQTLIYTS